MGEIDKTKEQLIKELADAHHKITALENANEQLQQDSQSQQHRIEMLEASENRLFTILQTSKDIIININSEGQIIFWNHAAEEAFGYSSNEMLEKPLTDIMPERFREMHDRGIARFVATKIPKIIGSTVEVVGLRKDGSEFPIELSLSHWLDDGELFFSSIIRDITIRKEAELNLQMSKEQLQLALNKEKELNSLKDDFMTMVSHEFRTPMAIIKTSSQLLSYYPERLTEEKQKEYLTRIEEQIARLTEMLDNIRLLIRTEASPLELTLVSIDLKTLCHEVVKTFQETIAEDYDIVLNWDAELNAIHADEKMLKIIIINLLSNAIKYSPRQSKIAIDVSQKDQILSLRISDEGIGIPPESLQKLFDPYFRAENVGNIQGVGLGLRIVKEFVELHGGKVEVDSRLNKGTTFTISLPNQAVLETN